MRLLPGMYGGFGIRLEEAAIAPRLKVTSHCRMVGYSGCTHYITLDSVLVDSGW
ncbi:hypothetical protein ACWC9T_17235 [Kitasatospora sp. NPDC001159]